MPDEESKRIAEIDEPFKPEEPIKNIIGEQGADERDKQYTKLLQSYLRNYRLDKHIMVHQKVCFYKSIVAMLWLLFVGSLAALIVCACIRNENSLAIIICAAVSMLGSLIALPTIIAKHLFPEKIDENIVQILQCMIDNDRSVREAQIALNISNKDKSE